MMDMSDYEDPVELPEPESLEETMGSGSKT